MITYESRWLDEQDCIQSMNHDDLESAKAFALEAFGFVAELVRCVEMIDGVPLVSWDCVRQYVPLGDGSWEITDMPLDYVCID